MPGVTRDNRYEWVAPDDFPNHEYIPGDIFYGIATRRIHLMDMLAVRNPYNAAEYATIDNLNVFANRTRNAFSEEHQPNANPPTAFGRTAFRNEFSNNMTAFDIEASKTQYPDESLNFSNNSHRYVRTANSIHRNMARETESRYVPKMGRRALFYKKCKYGLVDQLVNRGKRIHFCLAGMDLPRVFGKIGGYSYSITSEELRALYRLYLDRHYNHIAFGDDGNPPQVIFWNLSLDVNQNNLNNIVSDYMINPQGHPPFIPCNPPWEAARNVAYQPVGHAQNLVAEARNAYDISIGNSLANLFDETPEDAAPIRRNIPRRDFETSSDDDIFGSLVSERDFETSSDDNIFGSLVSDTD